MSAISTRRWGLSEDLAFYRTTGVQAAGLSMYKLGRKPLQGLEQVNAAGIRVSSLLASTIGTGLAQTNSEDGALHALKPSIEVARHLHGVPCFFLAGPSPKRMPVDEAFELLVDAMAPAVSYARGVGVPLAFEFSSSATSENGFLHTLGAAAELAVETDIGICLEIQNCWAERHLMRTVSAHVDRISVVQLSDFTVGEPVRLNRRVPGDGDIPLEWFLGGILDTGYSGPFELEVLGPHIEDEGYQAAIMRGLVWLSDRLARWGA